jgi:ssDNA-binding replication factor A large subunit
MGLPYVVLTESGATNWQKNLESSGYKIELDEEEIERCEKNGELCELYDHPRLVSMYPFCISRDGIMLRCLESKEHGGKAGLTFMPRDREERDLLVRVRQTLMNTGAVVE